MNILRGKKTEYSGDQLSRFKDGCFILIKYRGSCKYVDCSDNCPFYFDNNGGDDCREYFSDLIKGIDSEDLSLLESVKKWLKRYVGMTQPELYLFANQAEIEKLMEEKKELQNNIATINKLLNDKYKEINKFEKGVENGKI